MDWFTRLFNILSKGLDMNNHEPEGYSNARTRFANHFRNWNFKGWHHSYINLWAEGFREFPQWPARLCGTILLPAGVLALVLFESLRWLERR